MKRINFNAQTGEVLNVITAPSITIDHIDLDDVDTALQGAAIYHVDPTTRQLVVDSVLTPVPTYEELQQQLLIAQGVI